VLMLDFYRVLVLNCVEFRFGSGEIWSFCFCFCFFLVIKWMRDNCWW
jgi:hypothetical protein